MENALCVIELQSQPRGFKALDDMAKKARVRVVRAESVQPGKFLIIAQGEEANLEEAYKQAVLTAGDKLIDHVLLYQIHERVSAVLSRQHQPAMKPRHLSFATLECRTMAAMVLCADVMRKSAKVELLSLLLARDLHGRGLACVSGRLSDVEAALEAGVKRAKDRNSLYDHAVYPNPSDELVEALFGQAAFEE